MGSPTTSLSEVEVLPGFATREKEEGGAIGL